jgi:hypothetical protein
MVKYSQHAAIRAQQRGVPPLIAAWLVQFGEKAFDGNGGVIRYFTRENIRRMEREVGATPIRRLSEYLGCYLVQGATDGQIITMGKRYQNARIWRR